MQNEAETSGNGADNSSNVKDGMNLGWKTWGVKAMLKKESYEAKLLLSDLGSRLVWQIYSVFHCLFNPMFECSRTARPGFKTSLKISAKSADLQGNRLQLILTSQLKCLTVGGSSVPRPASFRWSHCFCDTRVGPSYWQKTKVIKVINVFCGLIYIKNVWYEFILGTGVSKSCLSSSFWIFTASIWTL